MINRLDQYGRPGGPQGKYLRKERMELRDLLPMTINLGGLPARGKSGQYKRRIRERLKSLKKQFQLFSHILVPVELDVQVTPRALRLGKDLDNIPYPTQACIAGNGFVRSPGDDGHHGS
jgi:hypothetical protein